VYGQTIAGKTYDDAFIAAHTSNVRQKLKGFLKDFLSPAIDKSPDLRALFEQELTAESFRDIMNLADDKDFFMHPELQSWEIFTNKLYDFMLKYIDPLSYENLEFQLADVKKVYDLLYVYDQATEVLQRHSGDDLNFYIAGQPVVISIMARIINSDMKILMPIGVVVIFIMLAFSFKSVRGVIIPLLTVVISVIWALGMMALTGTPITTSTSILPIVLLAVGSAYSIHFLNRYIEDAKQGTDRKKILRLTIEGVGVAILMAGLTTFSGFVSLSSSPLLLARHFGLFTAFGVLVALLLTMTLTPALLSFWRLPRFKKQEQESNDQQEPPTGFIESVLLSWGRLVTSHPKITLTTFAVATLIAGIAMLNLEFEGGLMADFNEDSPLKQSDIFINKNLTGTGDFNLVFKFRDRVNLENDTIAAELKQRIAGLEAAWQGSYASGSIATNVVTSLKKLAENPTAHQGHIEESVSLLQDIFNEEYLVELETPEQSGSSLESENMLNELTELDADDGDPDGFGDLGDLAESEDIADEAVQSGPFSEYTVEQIAGLKDINERLHLPAWQWETTGQAIIRLRADKGSPQGQQVMKHLALVNDIFAADIKQPQVLHKLETLRAELVAMDSPTVDFKGEIRKPTGFLTSPVDLVRKTYSVFYHNENPAFKKIPDADKDGFAEASLTDRGIIGVVLNQAQNSNRSLFESMVSADFKEFQVNIMSRDGKNAFIEPYSEKIYALLDKLFPEDDPYIKDISIGGQSPVSAEIATLIATSQTRSILQAMVYVFFITFFIFRSAWGGLYSVLPLLFTIIANFGMMVLMGWKINTGTVMVASISIGIGVDYTIHFLERFKAQLKIGDRYDLAYYHSIQSVGRAILINATSVAAGFLVLLLSDLASVRAMGLLMTGTMLYSTVAAITLLPALIFVMQPKFLAKYTDKAVPAEAALMN
jgi:predicted RND superfamily exporter protein